MDGQEKKNQPEKEKLIQAETAETGRVSAAVFSSPCSLVDSPRCSVPSLLSLLCPSPPGEVHGVPGVRQGGGTRALRLHLLPVRLPERRRHRGKHLAQPVDQRRLDEPDAGECSNEGGGVRGAGHCTR